MNNISVKLSFFFQPSILHAEYFSREKKISVEVNFSNAKTNSVG